jgi:hypothetical protein
MTIGERGDQCADVLKLNLEMECFLSAMSSALTFPGSPNHSESTFIASLF